MGWAAGGPAATTAAYRGAPGLYQDSYICDGSHIVLKCLLCSDVISQVAHYVTETCACQWSMPSISSSANRHAAVKGRH